MLRPFRHILPPVEHQSLIASLILNVVLFLLLLYVAFVQKKVIVSKEEIIQDYKDIPELSKLKSSLKDEITKLQTDKKIEELKKKFDLDKQKSIEAFSNEAYELYNVLIKLIFVYADYWYFEKVIEKMANIKSKESLLEQLKKRKKIYEEGKDYPRTKIVREVILMRLHAEGKLEL